MRTILLQRNGKVEAKAYISGESLTITIETQNGSKFTGINMKINETLIKNMILLVKELLATEEAKKQTQ